MFCQKCGKEIEDGTRFCEHCGAAQDAAAAGNPGTNSNAGVNPTMQASPYPAQAMNAAAPAKKKKGKGCIIGIIAAAVVVLVVVVVVVIIAFSSGKSLSVDDVKESHLSYYSETRKIGNVFANYGYFDNASWKEFDGETDDGESVDVVEFNADLTMKNGDAYSYTYTFSNKVTIQFYRDKDMDDDSSQIYGIWLNDVLVDGVKEDVKLDDYDFDDLLSSIYDNEIFVLYLSDYGITLEP